MHISGVGVRYSGLSDVSYKVKTHIPTDEENDLFTLITTLFLLKTSELKEDLEKALRPRLREMSSETFSNVIIQLGGRKEEIQYFNELYQVALVTREHHTPRGGFMVG